MPGSPIPKLSLEDEFIDIVGKAQRGLGLGHRELLEKTRLPEEALKALREGTPAEDTLQTIATVLGLNARALSEIGRGSWYPEFPDEVEGLAMANTPFDDMTVNAYVVWSPDTRDAFIIDTGTDAAPLLERCKNNDLTVRAILLTHTHGDHVAQIDPLKEKTGAPVFVNEHEAFPGAETFSEGKVFEAGPLRLEARLTSGHSPGGTTFVVSGLPARIAITGDSIFAGSMGGGMISYQDQKRNIQEKILTLPPDTLLFPGHGPPTTVEQETNHNPFFAK